MSTAVRENNRWPEIPPEMKGPVAYSAVFHVILLIAVIVGLPYVKKTPDPMSSAIPVEILPIAEKTTTNKPAVKAPPAPKEEIKEKPLVKAPAPTKVDAVEPPKELKPPVDKPKAKPVVPPPPTEKLEKAKPPEEKPKPDEKPQEDQQNSFDSLLKNLQDSKPQVDEDVPVKKDADSKPAPSPLADYSQQLTMSESDALRQQLSRCWSIQAGARYAEELVVEVRLTVSPDRHVTSAVVVDQWRYNQDSYFRAAADSAIRAVNSPQCETLQLPPDKYDSWKDIVVTFDPREML